MMILKRILITVVIKTTRVYNCIYICAMCRCQMMIGAPFCWINMINKLLTQGLGVAMIYFWWRKHGYAQQFHSPSQARDEI